MSSRSSLHAVLVAAFVIVAGLRAPVLAQTPPPTSPAAAAQQPPPPPPPPPPPEPPPPAWSGSLGAGLAVTSGNTDTSTLNVSFDVASRPKMRHVFKAEALYLRGEEDDELNVDRFGAKARHEYNFRPKVFLFGQLEYLRDPFKDIDYLVAPTAGVGYKVFDTEDLQLAFDGGLGMKWEKSTADGSNTDGAVAAGQRFLRKLSKNATFTQSIAALWAMDDFGDALYTFKIGLAAGVTQRLQLKFELVDLYKTKPLEATIEKNDVSIVTAIAYKF